MFTSRVLTRSIATAAVAAVIATGINTTASAAPLPVGEIPIVCSDEGFDLSLLDLTDLTLLQGLLGGLSDGLSLTQLLAQLDILTGVTRTVCEGLPDVPLPDGLDLGDLGLGDIGNLDDLFSPGVKLLTSPIGVSASSPLVGLVLVAGATDPATGTVDVLLNGEPVLEDVPLVNILGLGVGVNLELPATLLAGGGALTVRYNGTIEGGTTTSDPKTIDVSIGLLSAQVVGASAATASFPAGPKVTGTVQGQLIDSTLLDRLSLLNGGSLGILDSTVTPIAPTGTVTAKSGTKTIGTATLGDKGAFSFISSSLPIGTSLVTLRYDGDTLHSPSSKAINATLRKGTPTLATSAVNSTYGSSAKVSVRVSGTALTGTADLKLGSTTVQTKTLVAGVANFALPARQVPGSYGYTVSYRGSSTYNAASKNVTVKIAKAKSGVTSTIAPVAFGTHPVVAVRLSGVDALGGSIRIFSGATQIGGGAIGNGKANITLNKQYPVGRRTLTVKYYGSATHLGAQANTILTVGKAFPSITVVPDTRTVKGKVYLRTSVRGVAPVGLFDAATTADAKPTGAIVLSQGTRNLKSVSVANATAPRSFAFDLGALPKGTSTFRLRYAGDSTYRPASVEVRVVIK